MLIKLIQIIKDHRGDPCLGEVFYQKNLSWPPQSGLNEEQW